MEDAQKQAMLEKFKKSGIPAPVAASIQPMTGQGGKFAKLDEIRRGAKRGEFRKFIQATNTTESFQEIPVPKARRDPRKPTENTKPIPQLENFAAKKDPQLDAITALFETDAPVYTVPSSTPAGRDIRQEIIAPELNVDNIGPSIDYAAALSSKLGIDLTHLAKKQPMQENTSAEQSIVQKSSQKAEGSTVITEQLIELMQTIAESTIKKVLKEYEKTTSQKRTYIPHSTLENVILIEGKPYKIVPVTLVKKKSG